MVRILGDSQKPNPQTPNRRAEKGSGLGLRVVQGYLVPMKQPPTLGSPQVPRHEATVGSYGGGGYYERGTPVGRAACRTVRPRL